jgi:hypothetical protein
MRFALLFGWGLLTGLAIDATLAEDPDGWQPFLQPMAFGLGWMFLIDERGRGRRFLDRLFGVDALE